MGTDYKVAETSDEMARAVITSVEAIARIKETRQALKLTQVRLCKIADMSLTAWNNAETGDNRISIDLAIKFCDATGATLDWIYRGISSGLPTAIQEAMAERRRRNLNVDGR